MFRLGHRSHIVPGIVVVTLLAVALVAAVGVCVADAHTGMHHGAGSGSPLCVGAPGGSPTAVTHLRLAIVGQAVAPAPAGVMLAPLDVLELPPKR